MKKLLIVFIVFAMIFGASCSPNGGGAKLTLPDHPEPVL